MNRYARMIAMLFTLALFMVACASEPKIAEEFIETASDQIDAREDVAVEEEPAAEPVVFEQIVEVEQEVEVTIVASAAESVEADAASDDAMSEVVVVQPAATPNAQPTASPATAQDEPRAILPQERSGPDTMIFDGETANPFVDTREDHLSTFAIDVDTGSYTLMRSYLSDYGSLPPAESVRVEEYVNYFDQNYAVPQEGAFAIHLEGAPSPYGEGDNYRLVRVGIQGYEVPADERPSALLIFVVDTSGSMDREDRLELAKESLRMLVNELRPDDRIGIVEYGSRADVVLNPTAVRNADDIYRGIDNLRSNGSTNVEEGIEIGYRLASKYRLDGDIARLIVVSDGVANVGETMAESILDNARRGISLSTYGFGMGNYNDTLMEQLANQGDGTYNYIDTLREAQRVFVKDLSGTLMTIAKDAKIQVVFNEETVWHYRLIGYENRAVADADFRNDTVDAGEIGAGHSVTALYEIRVADGMSADAELMKVHVRYADPDTGNVTEIARAMQAEDLTNSFEDTSDTFQLSAIVAEFAELLRGSYWSADGDITRVWQDADNIARRFPQNGDVLEFADLVESAADYAQR